MMFAVEPLKYNAFAKDEPLPLDGMNFSKSQDVFSKDGVLQTTINAAYHTGNVDNQSITSMVYNGSLGGPTLHVYPGDRIELNLINNLHESTNIHYHGLHVSPSNNSDNVFLELLPKRHSNILLTFLLITLQVCTGIIHIYTLLFMDKFRPVYRT
jgi:suppressor of ftsI